MTPVGGHGSHLIGDLARSDALVVVPEGVGSVPAGEQVQVLRLDEGVLMSEPSVPPGSPGRLTHVDGVRRRADGRRVERDVTARTATASGRVLVSSEVVALLLR